jgi:hypothetical protein
LGPLIVGTVGYRSGSTSYLYLTGMLSHGPISAVSKVYLDDKTDIAGVTFEGVLGTAGQTPLASLVTAYAQHSITYADAMANRAYVNVKLKSGIAISNMPRLNVMFYGRTLYDMRTATTAYSENPTLALADYIKSTAYGAGKDYDAPSFVECANFNDALAGGEVSRKIALAITNRQSVEEWINTLALYANVEVYQVGGVYFASPRKAKGSSFVFTDDNVIQGSVSIARLPMRQVPTISTVKYTDTTVSPWSTRDSVPAKVANLTDANARDSTVVLPGINRASQAAREALERLNWNIYGNTSYVWAGFDDSAGVRKGDVVTFSNSVGVVDKLVWINNVDDKGFGRYQFNGTSYDPLIFSGTPASGTTPIDASVLVPGLTPPVVADVVGMEELYQKQNGDWDSRVRFEWTATGDDVSFDHFAIAINDCTDPGNEFQVDSRNTTLPSTTTYALQEGRQYRLYVQSVSVLGIAGEIGQSNIVSVLGKLAKPGDVPGFAGTEAGGTVYLRWQKAVDIDVTRYEVRRGAVGSAWDAKVSVIILDALGVILPSQPEGVQEYSVKAIDSVGGYSINPSTLSIQVTLDSGSVLLSQPFTTYALTNMQGTGALSASLLNAALSANGASASASSEFSVDYAASFSINGHLTAFPDSTGFWHSGNFATHTLTIAFGQSRTINKIILYAQNDDYANQTVPVDGQTGMYAVRAYTVEVYTGSAWVQVGAVGPSNAILKNTFNFAAVTCTQMRFLITSGSGDQYARVCEVEAWTAPVAGAPYFTIDPTGLWADGADVPNNAVGTFDDSLKDNLIGFPTNAAGSSIVTGSVDFGSPLEGRWNFGGTTNVVDSLAGAPFNDALIVRKVEYSLDNAAWTQANSGDQFTARYIRLRATCPTGYVMRALDDFAVTFNTTLREERGTVTVSASGTATVTLANRYARWVTIQVTIQGSSAGVCTYDNVIVGTGVVNKFDVWKFTTAGAPSAGTLAWIFQGLN